MSSDWSSALALRVAKLEHAETHRIVGRRHFQRHAAVQPRPHARLQRFQFRRRSVGGHHHLLGAVEQHVDQMAELVLDGFPLQELHVVDDEEVDVAQLFLERQRIVVADRGRETPHEILRRQVDDARLGVLLQRFSRDRLQEMGFAQPHRRMQEERIEARHGLQRPRAPRRVPRGSTGLRRRTGTCSAGRAASRARPDGIPVPAWPDRGAGAGSGAAVGDRAGAERGLRRTRRLAGRFRLALDGRPGKPRGAANDDLDPEQIRLFLAPEFGDQVEIVAVDP